MGTSAPAVKTHDFPITEPYKPPLSLPQPDPDRIIPLVVTVPIRQPVRVIPIRQERIRQWQSE
jgi:regulator of PEP synthase PpsR (kinase-PPPase family)